MEILNVKPEQFAPVADTVIAYSKFQEQFTRGTRQTGEEGWQSITLEWGKKNKSGEQLKPLQAVLEEKFPNECSMLGPVKLLEIAASVTGKFRITPRIGKWTPQRGPNAGKEQETTLHDVYFAGSNRQFVDPFAEEKE